MTSDSDVETGTAAESVSIVTLVSDWMSATSSRIRLTAELAVAEARLAATSLTLMVLMGVLSALLLLVAWGLVVAGLVAAAVEFGASLWLTLAALSLLHAFGAWLLWRWAVRLGRYMEFTATRQQITQAQEFEYDVVAATTTR